MIFLPGPIPGRVFLTSKPMMTQPDYKPKYFSARTVEEATTTFTIEILEPIKLLALTDLQTSIVKRIIYEHLSNSIQRVLDQVNNDVLEINILIKNYHKSKPVYIILNLETNYSTITHEMVVHFLRLLLFDNKPEFKLYKAGLHKMPPMPYSILTE